MVVIYIAVDNALCILSPSAWYQILPTTLVSFYQSHYLKNYFLLNQREFKKAKILLSALHLTTTPYFVHYIFIVLLCGGAIT